MAVAQSELRARAVTDRDAIAAFLRSDRLYAVYALGDLDGPQRRRAVWGLAYDAGGRPTALAEHHDGLVPQPLFLMGDPEGCQALLESVIKPRDAYFQASDEHDAAIAALYEVEAPSRMLRMVVDQEAFAPFAGAAERLTPRDIDDLNRLYQLGFRTGFPISVLEDGVYYGVRIRGRLVSAAGTHVINPREGVWRGGERDDARRLSRPRLRQDGHLGGDRGAARAPSRTWPSTFTPRTHRPSRPTCASGTVSTASWSSGWVVADPGDGG